MFKVKQQHGCPAIYCGVALLEEYGKERRWDKKTSDRCISNIFIDAFNPSMDRRRYRIGFGGCGDVFVS